MRSFIISTIINHGAFSFLLTAVHATATFSEEGRSPRENPSIRRSQRRAASYPAGPADARGKTMVLGPSFLLCTARYACDCRMAESITASTTSPNRYHCVLCCHAVHRLVSSCRQAPPPTHWRGSYASLMGMALLGSAEYRQIGNKSPVVNE